MIISASDILRHMSRFEILRIIESSSRISGFTVIGTTLLEIMSLPQVIILEKHGLNDRD